MVRLEKIAYEKIINSKTLHRARNITSPKKTDFFSEIYLRRAPTSRLVSMITEPVKGFFAGLEWRFMRSCLLQRGISFEDALTQSETEFRRGILGEQVNRESMHPYNIQLNMWRRMGYGKVDASMMGFEAPEYIKEDVRKQTYMEVYDRILSYRHMLLSNYMAELTPVSYMGRGSLVLLELFIVHNLFSRSAWNRYFFNEEEYLDSRKYVADFERVSGAKPFDINTESGRKGFEAFMTHANKRFPGMFAPDGEDFDFKAFYNRSEETAVAKSQHQHWTRGELDLLVKGQEEAFIVPKGEDLKGWNNVGKILPGYFKRSPKGLMQ